MAYKKLESHEEYLKAVEQRKDSGSCLCQIINAILLAGVIILFTGIYYYVVKAGIPYQDPPLELQIQYAVHMGIGEVLTKNGFLISICAGVGRLILKLALKKRKNRNWSKRNEYH